MKRFALIVPLGLALASCGQPQVRTIFISAPTPSATVSPMSKPAPPPPNHYTRAQYDQIQKGMTYAQVVEIMGNRGELGGDTQGTTFDSEPTTNFKTYAWSNNIFDYIAVSFDHDQVVEKRAENIK